MALINCPECGKQISNKASACPNCGFPIKNIGEIVASETEQGQEEEKIPVKQQVIQADSTEAPQQDATQGLPQEDNRDTQQKADEGAAEPAPKKSKKKFIIVLLLLAGIVIAVLYYIGVLGGMAGKYKLVSVTVKDSKNAITRTATDLRTDYYLLLKSDGTGYIYGNTIEHTINWSDSSMTMHGLDVFFERSGRKITITVDYSPLDAKEIWVFQRTTESIPDPPANNNRASESNAPTTQHNPSAARSTQTTQTVNREVNKKYVGTYIGEHGCVLVLLSNGKTLFYQSGSKNGVRVGGSWKVESNRLKWTNPGILCEVYAVLSGNDQVEFWFEAGNRYLWLDEGYSKVSDSDKQLTAEEYDKMMIESGINISDTASGKDENTKTKSSATADDKKNTIDYGEFLKEFEKYVDEFAAFMEKYKKNPNDVQLAMDYANFLMEFSEKIQEIDEIDTSRLSSNDLETYNRIMKKLGSISY